MELGKMPLHVVVETEVGSVFLGPREGEHLDSWSVSEKAGCHMIGVCAVFRKGEYGPQRQEDEYFNASLVRRIYVEGED